MCQTCDVYHAYPERLLRHRVHLHRCLHHPQTGLTGQVAQIYAPSFGLLLLRLCDNICMPHVSEYPQCHAWHIDHLLLRMHRLSTNMSTDTLQGVSTDPEKLGPKAAVVNGKNVLQLLNHCNGSFRPGILTALVGSSGAGKTTLMDVLAGRKTSKPTCAFRYLQLCLLCTRLCLSCIRLCLSCMRLCLSCIKLCLSCTRLCLFLHHIVPFLHEIVPFLHQAVPSLHQTVPFLHHAVPFLHQTVPFLHRTVSLPASDCAFPYSKLCLCLLQTVPSLHNIVFFCIRLCLQAFVARNNVCPSTSMSMHHNRTELC